MLKDGVKYHIESTKLSGEPLTPKNVADKWTRQCGVLVKDKLPISIQEWKEPKTKRPVLLGSTIEPNKTFGIL